MITSLTGFGRAEVEEGDLHYSVEIRSVNNRYLEIGAKLPRSLVSSEMDIKARIRSRVDRGKLNVMVQESRDTVRQVRMDFDTEAASNLVHGLRVLGDRTGLEDDLKLSHLTGLLDWFTGTDDDDELSKQRLNLALKGVDEALDEFIRMREEEGANLQRDFDERLTVIADKVDRVKLRADENREGAIVRMRERIEKYVPSEQVDEGRLEQEVAYIVDRLDITEEVVRLASHIQLFRKAMEEGGSVGKRLNFILQEMNREVNTIGSKANDAEIAALVVDCKEELEKMREQVQNVA